ncbi:MAG: pyridoxamine 5'-phosphate oxidase family protein [Acidimicrobiia bacterium]|nr:pyridoxamine 5'-phosphate oxidase family protein [Acidimicrobiia bacterium]
MRREVHELQPLSPAECERLLSQKSVGRVGISVGALPVVLPVNYAMLDGDVVIRTGVGTKLDTALAGAVVAFEIDQIDAIYQEGWSVLLQGRASVMADPDDLERAERLPLRPWAPGGRNRYIRIPAEVISGRRIGLPTNGGGNTSCP